MTNQFRIIKFDYTKEFDNVEVLANFKNELADQPDHIVFDETQSYVLIASCSDTLWIALDGEKEEIDIDETFNLNEMKCVAYHNKKFYLLANKSFKKLGYFLLELDIDLRILDKKPEMYTEKHRFIIKWLNKLNIADASLEIMKSKTPK
jgi:2C-methyl-D-erythritol 2,4-cyclodiphosphate synthase